MNVVIREVMAVQGKSQLDLRQTVIEILRQQEGLKKKLHTLLDQLGTNGRPSIG